MTTALNGRVVDPMGNIAQDLILFNFSPEKLYLGSISPTFRARFSRGFFVCN